MEIRLWVLGAADPEMATIERLLSGAGERVAYATVDSVLVHPGNAYRATGYVLVGGDGHEWQTWDGPVIVVECACDKRAFSDNVTVIDHHRPGDPGYGRPPEEFLAASSLGQMFVLLQPSSYQDDFRQYDGDWCLEYSAQNEGGPMDIWHVGVPREVVFTAAADHCLESAYRGKCPGVDPDALMRWRVESRAAFQGRSVEAVLADVEAARKELREAVEVVHTEDHDYSRSVCDGCARDSIICNERGYPVRHEYADLRGEKIPELPEASAREGIPFLSDGLPDPSGRVKVVLQSAPPEMIRRFLDGRIVPGLVDCYGDPARGFAGGYCTA